MRADIICSKVSLLGDTLEGGWSILALMRPTDDHGAIKVRSPILVVSDIVETIHFYTCEGVVYRLEIEEAHRA